MSELQRSDRDKPVPAEEAIASLGGKSAHPRRGLHHHNLAVKFRRLYPTDSYLSDAMLDEFLQSNVPNYEKSQRGKWARRLRKAGSHGGRMAVSETRTFTVDADYNHGWYVRDCEAPLLQGDLVNQLKQTVVSLSRKTRELSEGITSTVLLNDSVARAILEAELEVQLFVTGRVAADCEQAMNTTRILAEKLKKLQAMVVERKGTLELPE